MVFLNFPMMFYHFNCLIERKRAMENKTVYRSRCWCCNNIIRSDMNTKCPDCGWYICSVCGACSYYCAISIGNKFDFKKYEKLFKKTYIFKNCDDLSVFKAKVCKSNLKEKIGTSIFYYDCSEALGEYNGIQYISDRSPLGKWVYEKKVGDTFRMNMDGILIKYELIGISEENNNSCNVL